MELNDHNNKINNKINNLNLTITNLNNLICKIDNNIESINNIYMNYEYNKNLNLNKTNSYLKFQVDLLNNEKIYYSNIKNFILTKLMNEIYYLSENIIIILTTIHDLDIGLKEEKKILFDQILKFKKQKQISNIKILESVNITTNNLKLINEYIRLFEKYILDNENTNLKNNIHIKYFKINLMNKKKHYDLEYNKCFSQFIELLDYFNSLCDSINNQYKNTYVLDFFIKKEDEEK